jgi:phosphoribosylaminoimidazolecarboxamide formyltransferase/IMP cyclohydrolase
MNDMKRALISVSDKTGLPELARELVSLGYELVSTGGTAALLQQEELPVTAVSDVTGFPECLDGRVKTLHPKIHGGILAVRSNPEHMQRLLELDITPIDLLIINLYPFRSTILQPGASHDECIEKIDIGGPSMLRAAAKNYQDVTVLVDPSDYAPVMDEIRQDGQTSGRTRLRLARKVFEHTAAYDALIAGYFAKVAPEDEWPQHLTLTYDRVDQLRYGENPHQQAVFYSDGLPADGSLTQAEQLGGKELSYNNIADTDAAIALLREFAEPTVVAVKHANPCGVGSAADLLSAWKKAFEADSVSIYGGIVALNRTVDLAVAQATKGVFIEVMVAPDYTPDALAHLQERKNLRVLRLPAVAAPTDTRPAVKAVYGGILVQDQDNVIYEQDACRTVTEREADPALQADLAFAMKVVKHTKSNAIVLAKDLQTVGIGPGQPNRITSVNIAVSRAGDKAKGSVLASDAFFPFDDCVRAAAAAGVVAIIQPGGSMRDQASIDACNETGLPMVFTGIRHFRH